MAELAIRYEPPPPECFEPNCSMMLGARENGLVGEFAPAFEVRESARELRIEADVPGLQARDLSVYVVGGKMTIWGRRERPRLPKRLQFHTYERTYGTFWRTFRPESSCDWRETHAMLRRGVLTIVVRKVAAAPVSGRGQTKDEQAPHGVGKAQEHQESAEKAQ